jgi:hypothetical protein
LIPLIIVAVDSIDPSEGPDVGGTLLTITGTDFQNDPVLQCVFDSWLHVNATFIDSNTIQCVTPPGYGTVTVEVMVGTTTTQDQNQFTYYDTCPNDCSGHGECYEGICYCDWTYNGTDCSVQLVAVDVQPVANK